MCILAIAVAVDPRYRFVVVGNRDERFDRPTQGLHDWQDARGIVGGKDLKEGGSWMAINRRGRIAAITNFRDPSEVVDSTRSRGLIVCDALAHEHSIPSFLDQLQVTSTSYRGFNLLLAQGNEAWVYEHRTRQRHRLSQGIHVLSNGPFMTPWPKAERLKTLVQATLSKKWDADALLETLSDTQRTEDHLLPQTGVSLSSERALSSINVIGLAHYGTRTSTVMMVRDDDATVVARERQTNPQKREYRVEFFEDFQKG